MKTFSIIIPTFNSAKTLPVSLQSIANQTFKDVEVIVMDGASSDDTLMVAHGFENSLEDLKIISKKDNGIYDAMNKGLDQISGKWVLFLGSDDSLYQNSTLQQVNAILEHSQAKVVYGNAHIVGDTGWAKDGTLYAGEFDIHKLLNQNICHQAMFYNVAFIKEQIGTFNTEYVKSSDWDFNLRCWAKQPFEFIDLTIANFLAGGFSTDSTDQKIASDFVDNVLAYFSINPFHALVNNPNFIFYKDVVKKQREQYPFRYKLRRFKNKVLKKLRVY
ncbi:MAG: glycosyltransferase family 2 protein [Gilvibacter sp.]